MTRVKICGIKEEVHALAAVEAGADFIGFVFAPSRRQVSMEKAREIVDTAKKSSSATKTVGVFVDTPASEVNKIADFCGLDWVQLSGDESWEYCHQITRPVIKAIRISQQPREKVYAELTAELKELCPQRFIVLLDSQVEGQYGGTGVTFNWSLARQVAKEGPVIIAGGLNSRNVAQAIEIAAPWGVDVSSGVETDETKDIAKMKAFIEAVRRADDNKR
ncbi:MAG: phosphoribosylanthranilate isomerase [Dehalococcoidia bacterium]|nr:phosphoribosylanthranilate isomerase [Dehalococcoidia bacterium]